MTGAELIAKERQRQIDEEGWTTEHDMMHGFGDLATAGACYALDAAEWRDVVDKYWIWDSKWWKPTPNDKVRQLVKAGALIAAEIDKIQRRGRTDDQKT